MDKTYLILTKEDLERLDPGVKESLLEATKERNVYDDIHLISDELKSQAGKWKDKMIGINEESNVYEKMENRCLEASQLLQRAAHVMCV